MFTDTQHSPSKGKAKDVPNSRWEAGWWEFYPLVERLQRSVVWTKSSTLITSHPVQPRLISRLFSSSKEYAIVTPEPVASSPSAYDPPKIITVSPDDIWLFAYFPGLECDGVGCLWKRGYQVDSWAIKESWSFPRGAGVIEASWVGSEREWIMTADDSITRLPSRGPLTPVSDPTLMIVTQEQRLQVYYLRDYGTNLKVLSCSLVRPDSANENQSAVPGETIPGTARVCVGAAIGQCYNGPDPNDDIEDPDFPLFDARNGMPRPPSPEWESSGEEAAIELCEVKLSFDGTIFSLKSKPLPSIHYSTRSVIQLTFICPPALKPQASNPSLQSPKKDGKSQENTSTESNVMYLVAGYLDFGKYTEPPQSEMVLHTLTHQMSPSVANPGQMTWLSKPTSRSFTPGVMSFFTPIITKTVPIKAIIYAGVLDTSGYIANTKPKPKSTPIGKVIVLKLPELSDDTEWESSAILSSVELAGSELPLSVTTSPNGTLLGSMSAVVPTQTSFHALPKRHSNPTLDPASHLPLKSLYTLPLVSALLARKSTADISFLLSNPSVKADLLAETLYGALSLFETSVPGGLTNSWMSEVIGTAVEIYRYLFFTETYRSRALRSSNSKDRQHFMELHQTALEACTVAACLAAFEDCQENDAYDLEAVWQLVSLSNWIVGLLERLLRECLTLDGSIEPSESNNDDGPNVPDVSSSDSHETALHTPILLHLAHPYLLSNLRNVLSHINAFRAFLGTLTARGETAQLASDVLFDLVDSSGVGLPDSSSAINKPHLFIKASDLVDELSKLSKLSISGQNTKEKDIDVITKGLLLRHGSGITCLRCGGRSEVTSEVNAAGRISRRWRAWEKTWLARCICGGLWVTGMD
ncbi:hypothetical protein SERLADRAFT_418835 [Serpula lacrymans var. lacrymans S7.9]|uniref:Mediator complex subunit 16 C-terminal domain-containing protein n=1 Tax=Serpula lacrymans var. lacrymans (strain S7.9) TaxID=578457 RepID=F8PE45_SERL9|nr:uncharacterized protein SERLADRAFT_418835 [Serpula lacrymans var. lacrymans S7.9]EGO18642.1 hypothetical protein SERLADRAFT_418835 [Serpula lacrymans var. lacrymans S7.9]